MRARTRPRCAPSAAEDRCRRPRAAFTLLELLVALVLLDVGLLALVGTSAAVARSLAGAAAGSRALDLASARIERTLASPCRGPAAGMATPMPGAVEWWTDRPEPNGGRTVSDSVVVTTARGIRIVALHTAGRC
jgi:Tfp pilus assembly protein PilV